MNLIQLQRVSQDPNIKEIVNLLDYKIRDKEVLFKDKRKRMMKALIMKRKIWKIMRSLKIRMRVKLRKTR
jgi:hypothetical protein